jgi:hypothetical protein
VRLSKTPRIALGVAGLCLGVFAAYLANGTKPDASLVLGFLAFGAVLGISAAFSMFPRKIGVANKLVEVEFGERIGSAAASAPPETRARIAETLGALDAVSPTAGAHARMALAREDRLSELLASGMHDLDLQSGDVVSIAGHRPDKLLLGPKGHRLFVDEWVGLTKNHAMTYQNCLDWLQRARQDDHKTVGMLLVGDRKRPTSFVDDSDAGFWYVQLPHNQEDAGEKLTAALRAVPGLSR